MKDFFDRKTFDPVNNAEHKATLNILRSIGRQRIRKMTPSTAFQWALRTELRNGFFLDLGCGDSPDALIAHNAGFTACGIDLFPPTADSGGFMIRADVAEHIPMNDASQDVIISQAMLDLIEPTARLSFFREVDRVLKPGGAFFCYIQWLQSGWGFDLKEEHERALAVWPSIEKRSQGFIVRKEMPNE